MRTRNAARNLLMSIALLGPFVVVFSFPSLTPHPHNDDNVEWERDGTKDGSVTHNHIANRDFGEEDEALRIYNASSCWDNTTYAVDTVGKFDLGHCFINEYSFQVNEVRYEFVNYAGNNWNAAGQQRVRDAFNEWNGVYHTPIPGQPVNATGIRFKEGTPANLQIRMNNIPVIGQWDPETRILEFDTIGRNWSYQKSKSGLAPSDDHFYSVALHETGHVLGLAHRVLPGDVMYPGIGNAVVGAAEIFNGIHHDELTFGAVVGAIELYSQPVGMPAPPTASVELLFCIGWNATYHADWDGHVSHPGDSFEVQYQDQWGSWLPGYTGTGGATEVSNKIGHVNMRVKIICIGGTTVWVNFGTNEGCMNGPPV